MKCINLHVKKWIAQCIKQAADDGKIEIVQYLYDHPLLKSKCRVVRGAAVNGHFSLFKWFHHQDALTYAASGGHLHMVHRIHGQLRKRMKPLDRSLGPAPRIWQHNHKESIDEAATFGSLELVKWLHKNRKWGCSDAPMSRAAYKNYIDLCNGSRTIEMNIARRRRFANALNSAVWKCLNSFMIVDTTTLIQWIE